MRSKAYITACLFFFVLFSGLIHAEKSKKPVAKKPSAHKVIKVVQFTNHTRYAITLRRSDCLSTCAKWLGSRIIYLQTARKLKGGKIAVVKRRVDLSQCRKHFDLNTKFIVTGKGSGGHPPYLELTCLSALGGCAFTAFNFPANIGTKKIGFKATIDPQQNVFSGQFNDITMP